MLRKVMVISLICLFFVGGMFIVMSCAKKAEESLPVPPEIPTQEKIFTDLELVNLVLKYKQEEIEEVQIVDLKEIKYHQIIKVKGKLGEISYREGKDRPYFIIASSYPESGIVSCEFSKIGLIRARELIEKGLVKEGDEVIIQGEYQYSLINKNGYVHISLGECSLI